jgi:apolipoprotein N-acyltransferase
MHRSKDRPDFLIQLTNDAWFGTFAGPKQHLAQAKMRAIEQGLPMARAANSGISAMIGPYGRVLNSLTLNEAGYVDGVLPRPLPPTVYSKRGDLPIAILFLFLIFIAFLQKMTLGRFGK